MILMISLNTQLIWKIQTQYWWLQSLEEKKSIKLFDNMIADMISNKKLNQIVK